MVSGALLLPVKTDYITFIRKRLTRIAIPTLIWTLIYLALKIYNSESEINIARSIASIPFSAQGNGVLWFIYTLLGLYFLAPILSSWLNKASKRDLRFVLLLWCITLVYPLIDKWIYLNETDTGILYYFTGYAGYFLLGYYLRKYPQDIPIWLCILISGIGIITLGLTKYLGIEIDFYRVFWYLSIFTVSLAIVYWNSCRAIAKYQIINALPPNRIADIRYLLESYSYNEGRFMEMEFNN